MADRHEYYRQQANDAQRQAQRSCSEEDKATWLRLAQCWMALIRYGHNRTAESFDESADRLGTHQDISKCEQ